MITIYGCSTRRVLIRTGLTGQQKLNHQANLDSGAIRLQSLRLRPESLRLAYDLAKYRI